MICSRRPGPSVRAPRLAAAEVISRTATRRRSAEDCPRSLASPCRCLERRGEGAQHFCCISLALAPSFERQAGLFASERLKQTGNNWICSRTVHAPADPRPVCSHSMASNPWIVPRAVWKTESRRSAVWAIQSAIPSRLHHRLPVKQRLERGPVTPDRSGAGVRRTGHCGALQVAGVGRDGRS